MDSDGVRSGTWQVRTLGALGMWFVASGCATSRPLGDPRPSDGHVRVEFSIPATIATIGTLGDSLWLREVTVLRGTVERWTPDSVYLRVSGASARSGRLRDIPANRLAAVSRQAGIVYTDGSETVSRRFGIVVLIVVVGSVLAFVMMFRGMPES